LPELEVREQARKTNFAEFTEDSGTCWPNILVRMKSAKETRFLWLRPLAQSPDH
jgi:hypothetical protein